MTGHVTGVFSLDDIRHRCKAGELGAAAALTPHHFVTAADYRSLRMDIIPALRSSADHHGLIHALKLWLSANPDRMSDWMLLAATYGQLGERIEAWAIYQQILRDHPHDGGAAEAAIQFALRAGQISDAAAVADDFENWAKLTERGAILAMLALRRHGQIVRAIQCGRAYSEAPSGLILASLAESYLALHDAPMAARMAQRALALGHDTAPVRLLLAQAAATQMEHDRALTHLTAAVEADPKNVRALSTLGELMLVKRRARAARAYLERAVALAPKLVQPRALLARACKDMRDYPAGAAHFDQILAMEPANETFQRQAAGLYKLAGRSSDSERLLRANMLERRARLPSSLQAGLDALWDKVDDVTLPSARLDWAWSLRDRSHAYERTDWERRAKWGWLADRLIQEWLEASPAKADEAMAILADLGPAIALLEPAALTDGPLIFAGAHVGPLFAGPLTMQLMEFDSKWLASTPSYAGMAYNDALISTSDQSEAQVVRQTMAALDRGSSIAIAVDGAMTMAAPRVAFHGQEVTYSAFAARIAYQRKARSFFSAPQWVDGLLDMKLVELPRVQAGEALDVFSERWKMAWFDCLDQLLKGEPENLRLSGGIWRHIRPQNYAEAT